MIKELLNFLKIQNYEFISLKPADIVNWTMHEKFWFKRTIKYKNEKGIYFRIRWQRNHWNGKYGMNELWSILRIFSFVKLYIRNIKTNFNYTVIISLCLTWIWMLPRYSRGVSSPKHCPCAQERFGYRTKYLVSKPKIYKNEKNSSQWFYSQK